jgi:hypothetical protein
MTMVLPKLCLTTVDMNDMTSVNSSDEPLSDYERIRMQKIVRNNAKLRSLGLITQREEEQSNAKAKSWKNSNGHSESKSSLIRKSSNSKKIFDDTKNRIVLRSSARGARSSLRLQGLPALIDNDGDGKAKHQCSETGPMYSNRGVTKSAPLTSQSMTSNRTATYQHCAMRIRTMSHAQLQQRIRVVEQAAGRHCLLKLQIMVECFHDHKLHDLAQMAEEALLRLSDPLAVNEP